MYKTQEIKALQNSFSDISEAFVSLIYISRLLGQDNRLVLHGGGNTSLKSRMNDIFGKDIDVLHMKASGKDLSDIGPNGFVALDLNTLQHLRDISDISDDHLDKALRRSKLDPDSAEPSVETLLHAFVSYPFITHTHAEAILMISNCVGGQSILQDILGKNVCVIPYVSSGLSLAQTALNLLKHYPYVDAIVIMHHGIFTFANDAQTAYERMIYYVSQAERYIEEKIKQYDKIQTERFCSGKDDIQRCLSVIRGICSIAEAPGRYHRWILELRQSELLLSIASSKSADFFCRTGVLTPDHVIRTKNQFVYIDAIPQSDHELKEYIREAVSTYQITYLQYVDACSEKEKIQLSKTDTIPRVFLIRGVGLIALGNTSMAAQIAADIAERTLILKEKALCLGEYQPLNRFHVYHMEFWQLQQKKIRDTHHLLLQGQVAVVTGAAGAIGYGIAEQLLAAGAVVALCDVDEQRLSHVYARLSEYYNPKSIACFCFNICDVDAVCSAFHSICLKFGGIDIVVPNAGLAHVNKLESLDTMQFSKVIDVNMLGTFHTIKASIPIFKRQNTGGNIVIISSKNVFDPGASFGAYSASKAGAHQIGKIAALELAEIGVRVNMINPDAVFGDKTISSKLWDEIGPDRMKSRGLDPDNLQTYYWQRNLLKMPIYGKDVGNAVVFFASNQTPTTGATLPVDGGGPGAFPR